VKINKIDLVSEKYPPPNEKLKTQPEKKELKVIGSDAIQQYARRIQREPGLWK
jgi:hypothetical protein